MKQSSVDLMKMTLQVSTESLRLDKYDTTSVD